MFTRWYVPMEWGKLFHLQCGAPKIANLVNITPISLWFMVLITSYNYSFHGVYKPFITGGAPPCRGFINQLSYLGGPTLIESPNVLDSCDSCNPLVIERLAKWKTTMKLSGKSYLYMFIIYRPWLP